MSVNQEAAAFQAFIVDAKSYLMKAVYPALKAEYREAGLDPLPAGPLYAYYSWLERNLQKEKYAAARWGLLAMADRARPDLERWFGAGRDSGLLTLDPSVEIPDYYAAVDTHQHPGNLHGDDLAGYVYKASAGSTQPGQTTGYQLHERFANLVAERGRFARILDVGCGFGKSTLPLATTFRDAKVEGIDLSAPCLTLAATEASESQARNIAYRQADGLSPGYAPESFDLVTSTMLLHELPGDAVEAFVAESHRLLEPGGTVIHLDFRSNDDPFLRFIHHGHAARNNEPYMEAFDRMDIEAVHRKAGFTDIEILPFAEAEGTTDPDYPAWRLPWVAIVARKAPAP